ncbi:GMC family oxidoreductase N-terminal domain-containing protein [Actinoplanes oblitus]|uniref:GMC family oxidoreductase N-terminal domain-containing protein n=1 Tax=Actinoplanes oblitus TaxID=3040509 RepID=A0ABY8W5M9_9ACTN|nr:GMC family oxidoreductase N-terminal domain-containing protein [Actinoplanes oblitus]WIM92812.1 GMC family oxidoreductase N-terminal domain-containing protein [Actinoplanes oblitus]
MAEYTDVIVGAGSTGGVIASRLSADPQRRVLLIEAGPDFPSDRLPADVFDGLYPSFSEHDWGYSAEAVPGRSIPMARGKLVGGCSAINTSLAVRPDPQDLDEWAASGLRGWGWNDMLPYFKRLEDDQDFPDHPHGSGGPIPVRRWRDEEFLPLQRAMLDACTELGFARIPDLNGAPGDGIAVLPQNLRNGQRVSVALAYLDPARGRDNLEILPDSTVDRVLFDGRRATGVQVVTGGRTRTISGDRIILSAGAIGTPAILLRSGIGPADTLGRLGVPTVAELRGVGQNLLDHPACLVTVEPQPGVIDPKDPVCQTLLRYTAPGSAERDDMQMYLYSRIDLSGYATDLLEDAGNRFAFMLSVGIERPRSRGQVTIDSVDPAAAPRIELNYLSDPEDLRRMREGLRLAWSLAQRPELQKYTKRIVAPDEDTFRSDESVDAYALASATTHYHPAGTARMGVEGDPDAVVDDRGQVFGVQNLRVADASIMPTMIRANTNLTCIAIGERFAEWLR